MKNMLLCAIASAVATSQPVSAQAAVDRTDGTLLHVAAEGSVEVTPDTMSVEVSVVTAGATAAEALDRNNLLAGRLIQAVRASSIPVTSLQTSNLDVEAAFADAQDERADDSDTVQAPPRITGFVASNTLIVELAQVAGADRLISLMFEAGANEIRGPIFSLQDEKPAQRRAERLAVQEAQAEAQNYADALGMKVGRVIRVSDGRFSYGEDNYIVVTGSRIRPTPIEPGKITYTATVNIEYFLEHK